MSWHVSDETFRHAGETIFQSQRSLPETNTGYQCPRSNNGVRSCGHSSSTQFTAKFSGPPCPECTSSQPTEALRPLLILGLMKAAGESGSGAPCRGGIAAGPSRELAGGGL